MPARTRNNSFGDCQGSIEACLVTLVGNREKFAFNTTGASTTVRRAYHRPDVDERNHL
jgi:hypothetical protein